MKVREHLSGVGSLFLPCVLQESNSDGQTRGQGLHPLNYLLDVHGAELKHYSWSTALISSLSSEFSIFNA